MNRDREFPTFDGVALYQPSLRIKMIRAGNFSVCYNNAYYFNGKDANI